MIRCFLCLEREATKTNSHLVPHFLIKTAINKDGSKERDNELTFGISPKEFVTTYFGRNLTLDTIHEFNGKDLDDNEIKARNPFSVDHILCPECESKIGVLEEYYATNVFQKLNARKYGQISKDKYENTVAKYEKADNRLIILFVYSIFFRCSIGKYHGFKLNPIIEEKIRNSLYFYTQLKTEDTIEKLNVDSTRFNYFPVVNTYFESDKDADSTVNFVSIQHSTIPYFVYLNDVTFQLYAKEKHVGLSIEYFYGIQLMTEAKAGYIKLTEETRVIVLSKNKKEDVVKKTFRSAADEKITFLKKICRETHNAIFFKAPSEEFVNYFIYLVSNNEAPPAIRYGFEHIGESLKNTFLHFYQIANS